MTHGPRRASRTNLALALLSVVVSLLLAEGLLAAFGYRFSPLAFLPPRHHGDWRAFHMGARDPRLSGHDPLTVFDSFLLWRMNPEASREITPEGFRGAPPGPRRAVDFLIVALGDSNTLGPLDTADHWPGFLQDLVRMNRSRRRVRVVNAGVYGYSSFQGLRRLEEILAYQPDLVYFSFGANDAHAVRTPDAAYAGRARWLRSLHRTRLAPPLAHLFWSVLDGGAPGSGQSRRVPLPAYRSNLEAFVARARGAGVIPVLLTRPFRGVSRDPEEWLAQARSYNEVTLRVAAEQDAACVDVERALRDAPDLFVDDSHLQPRGYQRMARLLLQHLARLEILDTDFVHPGHLDLGLAPEMAEGLGDGLWAAEAWGGSRGRWTRGEASVLLERRSREPGLLVDVSFQRPRGPTTGRIEVNGRTLRSFSEANGRSCFRLDIRAVPERVVQVRFVVEDPFVPALASPAERDRRALGMFLHWVGLVQGASPLPPHDPRFLCASALGLGELEDERPELASGFWPREVWPDGSGRWTGAEATALLDRRGAEGTLLLDLSLQSPRGASRARIEANGEPLLELEGPNRRVRRWLDVRRVPGQRVAVRFIVDSAFVPRDEEPGNPDARQLGLFVRSLRLSDAPDAPP